MRHSVQLTYAVNTPEFGSQEWTDILDEMRAADPEYFNDAENLEPQVLEGNMIYYLLEEFHVGNHTDRVELVNNVDWGVI